MFEIHWAPLNVITVTVNVIITLCDQNCLDTDELEFFCLLL